MFQICGARIKFWAPKPASWLDFNDWACNIKIFARVTTFKQKLSKMKKEGIVSIRISSVYKYKSLTILRKYIFAWKFLP